MFHKANIIVRNPNEPQEQYQQEKDDAEYVAKLTTEDMGQGESACTVKSSRRKPCNGLVKRT